MGRFLSSVARSAARATGRSLAAHVVPDSLIPSWKTRKTLETGYSLLKRVAPKTKKSASAKRAKPASGAKRPAPAKPKEKFNKNAWAQGRAIAPADGFGVPPLSRSASRSVSSPNRRASVLRQQFSDLRREPRLVAQMGLDLLKAEYELKKTSFLSKLPRK